MSALFLTICNVFGQNSVLELLPGSETLEYDQKTGIHRLKGNVNFTYQGNTMYCDSALYFQKQNAVRAYGNVQVNKKDINLFCDSLFYDGKTDKATLWGNVRVRDNEYKLTTDTLHYNSKSGQAYFLNYGKVKNSFSNSSIARDFQFFVDSIIFGMSDQSSIARTGKSRWLKGQYLFKTMGIAPR